MKRKIKFIDNINHKITETEVVIRNLEHFEVQRTTRANIFTPKKGKGSFRRNKLIGEW